MRINDPNIKKNLKKIDLYGIGYAFFLNIIGGQSDKSLDLPIYFI